MNNLYSAMFSYCCYFDFQWTYFVKIIMKRRTIRLKCNRMWRILKPTRWPYFQGQIKPCPVSVRRTEIFKMFFVAGMGKEEKYTSIRKHFRFHWPWHLIDIIHFHLWTFLYWLFKEGLAMAIIIIIIIIIMAVAMGHWKQRLLPKDDERLLFHGSQIESF